MRWKDRRFSNGTKSRKILQEDYEELYTGSEYVLDYRLGRVVAIVWITFMFSVGMPMMLLVAIINLVLMYWYDKWYLLRFTKNPKNYNERPIIFSIQLMKVAFLWHLIVGFGMISYEPIMTPVGYG